MTANLFTTVRNTSANFFLLFLLLPAWSFSQQGEWTWMKGSNVSLQPPVYGVQGTSAPANTPGALYEAVEWTDLNGNFWLFGGLLNFGSEYNTMWKFDPSINEWTWMRGSTFCCAAGVYGTLGVPSPNNMPGARAWGTCTWTDGNGDLWLYGGIGYDKFGGYQVLSDLWRYHIATNEWTWIAGPDQGTIAVDYGTIGVPAASNLPGARAESNASWCDAANNLWMFGGALYFPQSGGWSIGGFGNDMWQFDVNTNLWVWLKGTTVLSGTGIYGTKGVPSISNYPPGRGSYSKWRDDDDNLWLFGGYNLGSAWNDLWRYSTTDNTWTWMSGPNTQNNNGTFGTQCIPDINNIPPSRYENRTFWTDDGGNFWLWGGITASTTILNDLWVYAPSTNEWTWVSGSTAPNQPGSYGTILVSSPTNVPPSKFGSIGWRDTDGNLWMMGGAPLLWDARNDLWRYVPDPDCPPLQQQIIDFGASQTELCEKFCIDFSDSSSNNPTSWLWEFPGGTPSSSTDQNPTNICYQVGGIYDVTLITSSATGNDTLTLVDYITVFSNPLAPTITQNGNVLTSSPASSYQWQFNTVDIPGATNQSLTITQSGVYTVVIDNADGCTSQASVDANVVGIEEISDDHISIYPNPANTTVTIEWLNATSGDRYEIDLFNTIGQLIYSSQEIMHGDHVIKHIDLAEFPAAVYFLELKTDQNFMRKKLIVTRN
jgi:PKD repeat protein